MFYNRALVIDDDLATRQVMKIIISSYTSMDVDIAENGFQAIEKAKEKKYDVIFIDYNMPGMNGILASREIRKIQPPAVIIMVTATRLDDEQKKEARKSINVIVEKPMELDPFIKSLQEILVKYSLHVLSGLQDQPLTAGNDD